MISPGAGIERRDGDGEERGAAISALGGRTRVMSWCFANVGALLLIGRTVVMSACGDRGVRGGVDGVDEGGGGGTEARAIWSGGREGRDDGAGGGAGRDGACTELVGRSVECGVECGVGGDDNDGEDGGLTTVLSP